jgi:G3E family GTPase
MSATSAATNTKYATAKSAEAPLFVVLGGFHGAGKTSLARRFGAHVVKSGKRLAFITNDPGDDEVDASILRAAGFVAEQISGGSFAVRADAFEQTALRLTANTRAEVIIAESIGASVNLAAAVTSAFRGANPVRLAPVTVVVDPIRAARFLKLDSRKTLSEDAAGLFRKQLEEADLILINKIDLLSAEALGRLNGKLTANFPRARILELSARTGAGLERWFNAVTDSPAMSRDRPPLQIDAAALSAAEARLACFQAVIQLSALRGFSCNPILLEMARAICRELSARGIEMAHLKMTLAPEVDMEGFIATLNYVCNDGEPETGEELPEPVERASLRINLRAEGKPDHLHAAVSDAMTHVWTTFPNLFARVLRMDHFAPHAPMPAPLKATASAAPSL